MASGLFGTPPAGRSIFRLAGSDRRQPRTGLAIVLPSDEPGSSIMSGKVNPADAGAMMMVCVQVIGSDTAAAMAEQEGNFEPTAFRPIISSIDLHPIPAGQPP